MKTIISKKRRLELAEEASRRLAANRDEETSLSRLYDKLILAMLAIFDSYDKSRPFYLRGARVDTDNLVSRSMDVQAFDADKSRCSVLHLWDRLAHAPMDELAQCPPSRGQHAALAEATKALAHLLMEIAELDHVPYLDILDRDWWIPGRIRWMHQLFWDFIDLTLEVQFREIDIFFDHDQTWQDAWYTDTSLVIFCCDASSKEYRDMWEEVKNKFYALYPPGSICQCDEYLSRKIADSPQAFCFQTGKSFVQEIGHDVRDALQTPSALNLVFDDDKLMWNPGFTIEKVFFRTYNQVIDYFRRARSLCKPTTPSYRKWLEAEAELIAHIGIHSDPITPEVAERIVSLANAAAREHWIEERINSDARHKDAETDELLKAIPVRLVDVRNAAGKSLRAAMQDPGGRPPKTRGGAKVMTQAEMAVAFGEPCNKEMVANWEARAAGKKRGANPPDVLYQGERIVYTAELRRNPTPDNQKRLTALIGEFQSRHRIRKAVRVKTLHMKSPETLARASGQIAAATRPAAT